MADIPPELAYIDPIMFRDRFVCQYCGADGLRDATSFYTLHVDHFRPLSEGGTDADNNRVTCCSPCNQWKGKKLYKNVEEAREALAARLASAEAEVEAVRAWRRTARRETTTRMRVAQPGVRWFDAESCWEIATPDVDTLSAVPFGRESFLEALVLTWHPERSCLLAPDLELRWTAKSSIGEGDLRGFCNDGGGEPVPLVFEAKCAAADSQGLTKSDLSTAAAQAVTGLRKHLERHAGGQNDWWPEEWATNRSVIGVVGDRWNLETEAIAEVVRATDLAPAALGDDQALRFLVVGVERHRARHERLVRSEVRLDIELVA